MNRRRLCTTALLVAAGLAGCPSDDRAGTTAPGETPTGAPGETPTGTSTPTEEPTPTDAESPTETIPPYTRELDGLRVENDREEAVSLRITIEARESDESRTLTVELDAGGHRDYEDVPLLDEPVTVTVTLGGETYEYTPTGQGRLLVTVTPEGVEFGEVVT